MKISCPINRTHARTHLACVSRQFTLQYRAPAQQRRISDITLMWPVYFTQRKVKSSINIWHEDDDMTIWWYHIETAETISNPHSIQHYPSWREGGRHYLPELWICVLLSQHSTSVATTMPSECNSTRRLLEGSSVACQLLLRCRDKL